MKIYSIQPSFTSFGKTDLSVKPYFDSLEKLKERRAFIEKTVLTKDVMAKLERYRKGATLRMNMFQELSKSVEGKHLNFFQKLVYEIKKFRIFIKRF